MTTNQEITTVTPSDSASAPPLAPGTIIANRFNLLAPCTNSRKGQIWKAEPYVVPRLGSDDDRTVILKFVSDNVQDRRCTMEEIRQAYNRIIGLEHPNICTVHSLEEDDQHGCFLVMERVCGKTLWQYAHTIPPTKLEPAEIIQILVPIADALDYLHSRGIIHRDISHEHIMIIVEYGRNRRLIPKLIDFSLAMRIQDSVSMTRASKMMSTEWYKAPEQWLGTQLDARTDQYMLGVVAYELLACALPFDDKGESISALMSLVVNVPVPPIVEYNDAVNEALAKAMAKDGKDRFDDCRSFIDALTKALQS